MSISFVSPGAEEDGTPASFGSVDRPDEDSGPAANGFDPNRLECQYPSCGVTLIYGGRGAKPKWCDDHKGGNSRPTTRVSGGRSKDDKLREGLSNTMTTMGIALMMVDPYSGIVVVDRTADNVDALMGMADNNPKVRKALESMLEVSAWAAVATAIVGMAAPIAAHHGILPIPAEAAEAQFLSVDARGRIARLPGRAQPRGRGNPATSERVPAPAPTGPVPSGGINLGTPAPDPDQETEEERNLFAPLRRVT